MNVLIDRHHAGLLYSLQLLFEDRLGATVYVPIGHEWWDEGYWQFGKVFGDDRLAQQYLVPGIQWEESEGWWRTHDVEFPERPILGVTREQFKEMEWDYVVATVQENQAGFQRAADEASARSVYQIGNRGQRADWGLSCVALVSAEAPFPDGRGVIYHQEYGKDTTFAYRELPQGAEHTVRSFVNCFDRMPEEFALFTRARAAGADFKWNVHGHDGSEGLVQPTTAVAHAMRNAGWAWHDKPQGDGFGHVIHYWASIGRPLVGHARYYRGLMPEPLWEDGVTCIDLDAHSPEEAVAIMREMPRQRHEEMCRAIRERVDAHVNFDAEEQSIRTLLGL